MKIMRTAAMIALFSLSSALGFESSGTFDRYETALNIKTIELPLTDETTFQPIAVPFQIQNGTLKITLKENINTTGVPIGATLPVEDTCSSTITFSNPETPILVASQLNFTDEQGKTGVLRLKTPDGLASVSWIYTPEALNVQGRMSCTNYSVDMNLQLQPGWNPVFNSSSMQASGMVVQQVTLSAVPERLDWAVEYD